MNATLPLVFHVSFFFHASAVDLVRLNTMVVALPGDQPRSLARFGSIL
jgi:hypothetical protein